MTTPRRVTDVVATWFRASARDLPWRRRREGYTALVAEAMLQQTQVARVIDRFERFIERFPDVHVLADASVDDVLDIWQGLGYYRRARHLHAAARMIRDKFDGVVPHAVDDLLRLPGVGRYTAGAIASIVFGERSPIVDGNVYRVLARLDGFDRPASDPAAQRWAWARATTLVGHAADPSAFNEGLMEFGAVICTPKAPRCDMCPMSSSCIANRSGRSAALPPPKARAAVESVHHHCVVIERGEAILMEQRPSTGLWPELWQPPAVESASSMLADDVAAALAVPVTRVEPAQSFTHLMTHRALTMHVFTARSRQRRGRWVPRAELDRVPMSAAHRRIFTELHRGTLIA